MYCSIYSRASLICPIFVFCCCSRPSMRPSICITYVPPPKTSLPSPCIVYVSEGVCPFPCMQAFPCMYILLLEFVSRNLQARERNASECSPSQALPREPSRATLPAPRPRQQLSLFFLFANRESCLSDFYRGDFKIGIRGWAT